jgi:hypothetical protein
LLIFPCHPAVQVQSDIEVLPRRLWLFAGQAVHDVAVLVSPLYFAAGQLTHESPERISPAPHSLVHPVLEEPDHPASHTQAEDTVLPFAPPVFVRSGNAVQLAALPAVTLYVSTGQESQAFPFLPKLPAWHVQLNDPGPVFSQFASAAQSLPPFNMQGSI